MAAKNKRKNKSRPRPPKVNIMAGMPRPGPISFRGATQALEQARELPLLGCWIMADWQDEGITPVVVARKQTEDTVIFGVYLVDIFCLGVKDAYWKSDISLKQFTRQLPMLCSEEPEQCEVSLAHELIYGSIEYARKFGFEPHPDYARASLLLDPPEKHPRKHRVTFGKDGKPLFVAGPYDNPEKIYSKLMQTAGEDNFDFLIGIEGLEEE
jgi:hypothetical protein